MLKMDKYIDMLIPRGGAGLHKLCREQSTIPVITGGIGVCHIFVDETAEIAPRAEDHRQRQDPAAEPPAIP
ncbi:gamma-glutamyl phosphate reductase [Klebsiella pneumoniae]|nr:gamma-glutamyl phosphate reductase [Klebsiella pneumoniae]